MKPPSELLRRENQILQREEGRRRTPLTVCVAAMCATNIIFGASDRMLTAGDIEFEPEISKIYSVTNSAVLMVAGESSLQTELFRSLYVLASERIRTNPQEWIPIGELADEYQRTYQRIKSKRAETRVLVPLGLTLDTFIQRQQQMAPSVVEELTKAIINFEMPGIEAIIAGIDVQGAHIYVANNSETSCRDAVGFAAIGAGSWHANSQFMFAGHTRSNPLPETLLLTYASKRRAEVAPGVGEGTDMFMMGPPPGTYAPVYDDVVKGLDKIYRRTRKRADRSVETANKEVNAYVDQLGKAPTPPTQVSTPEATAATKSTGEDPSGEQDIQARKPN